MKLLVRILVVVVVALVLWLAWRGLPGVRTRVEGTVDRYGGWTEAARRADPVGFIEFAEQKLAGDLVTFQESRQALAAAKVQGAQELDRTRELHASATELADEFKAAFAAAEAGGWPATVAGKPYGRAEMVDQVRLILMQRDGYADTVERFETVLEDVADREVELLTRIQTTKATLTQLKAQKELARIQKLTGEADELLAKVDALLGTNRAVVEDLGTSPVRTVEELVTAGAAAPPAAPASAPDPLDFLEGR